jgi:AAA ATPase domain
MKFHFEKLGLLDEADLEMADLTIICGENNTGKTYATYAVYGFLRSWRQLLALVLKPQLRQAAQTKDTYQIDLQALFAGKLNDYLALLGTHYIKMLPDVFATHEKFFAAAKVVCSVSAEQHDFINTPYQRSIKGQSDKLLATLSKNQGSAILDVLMAVDAPDALRTDGLLDFLIDAIGDIIFAPYLPDAVIASAERTGAAIFRKEFDLPRNNQIRQIRAQYGNDAGPSFHRMDDTHGAYAWPVKDDIYFVRRMEDLDRLTGALASANPGLIGDFERILGGSYKVIQGQGLYYQPQGGSAARYTMNESSSCVRALLDIGFYLRCMAKAGDIFIIDEPELNLHPKNQRAFARLIARMVNAGVKVFITTHSDYLVKEFNTLIMLAQRTAHTQKVQATHHYLDDELLDPASVRLYMTGMELKAGSGKGKRSKINTIKPATIHPDRGIEVSTFDTTIEEMNDLQSEILYGGEL